MLYDTGGYAYYTSCPTDCGQEIPFSLILIRVIILVAVFFFLPDNSVLWKSMSSPMAGVVAPSSCVPAVAFPVSVSVSLSVSVGISVVGWSKMNDSHLSRVGT